ncbi:MAG TPA: 5'-methylthioadenosine/S-adenosylhomocysteine nucleosidase [candidate division Zixibacteria bacterium]
MKKISILLLAVSLVFCFCGKSGFHPKVAIIYAFSTEGELLKSQTKLVKKFDINGREFYLGKLKGTSVVIVNSGVGMTNSAMTTQLVIDRFYPEKIIFTGICGGIDSSNKIGDVVIPEKWVTHDLGIYKKGGFFADSVGYFSHMENKVIYQMYLPVDSSLLAIAQSSATKLKGSLKPIGTREPNIKIGGIGASGNSFIDQKEKRKWLKEKLDAQIVDMESGAVVQVALSNNIPVIVVRSCSDLAGGSGSNTAQEELNKFFRVAADNSAMMVGEMVEALK